MLSFSQVAEALTGLIYRRPTVENSSFQFSVIQPTPVAEFTFGLTEGSFLQLNGQKHLRSVAEDLVSNKQKSTERIYQKRRRHGHYKTLKPGQNCVWFLLGVGK